MSTFNEIEITTPYGDTDKVLELNIDLESDAYVLKNVIKLTGTYTFSIWYKSNVDSKITFNVLGTIESVTSTSTWNKYVKTITVENLDEKSIYIIPSLNIKSYFYEGYLVEGIIDTSWLPAPEDLHEEIGSVRSELTQTASSIEAKITANDGRITSLAADIEGIKGRVEDAEGNINAVTQTATNLEVEIENARGDKANLSAKFGEIESSIASADGKASVAQQKADAINLTVSQKQNVVITAVRYIRDWLNGNSIDSYNRWVECRVVSGKENIASGIIPICKDISLNTVTTNNLSYYTNGLILDDDANGYIQNTNKKCLELDLGSIHYDIDYIQIWHYYNDNRVYNHSLQVSQDGISWVTLYDSNISGGYAETYEGKTYFLNNSSVVTEFSSITQKIDEVKSSVNDANGNISVLQQQADNISSLVGNNDSDNVSGIFKLLKDLDTSISNLKEDYEKNKEENSETISSIQQNANDITSTVATINNNISDLSQIRQDSKGWQTLFAQLDMYDMPNVLTNISLDINGITIVNPITGQATKITIDEFAGYRNYNDENAREKIFWIEEDTTKTTRLLCKKGWDTDYIKMTTNDFTSSGGSKGVVFVKSGGLS